MEKCLLISKDFLRLSSFTVLPKDAIDKVGASFHPALKNIVSNEIEQLRAKLKANRSNIGSYRLFAERCAVGESWLYKFVQGRIPNPGKRLLGAIRQGLAEFAD